MIKVAIKNRTIHISGNREELDHINRLTFGLNFNKKIVKANPHTKVKERITITATLLEMFPLFFLNDIKSEYKDFKELVAELMVLVPKINGGGFREMSLNTKELSDNKLSITVIDTDKSLALIKILSDTKYLRFKVRNGTVIDVWADKDKLDLGKIHGGKFNTDRNSLCNISVFGRELKRAAGLVYVS